MCSAAPHSHSLPSPETRACEGLLQRYVPCGVLLDDRRCVVRCFGGAERFLGGAAAMGDSREVLALADAGLRAALGSLLDAAAGPGAAFVRRTVAWAEPAQGGSTAWLELTVEPVGAEGGGAPLRFVRFTGREGGGEGAPPEAGPATTDVEAVIARLRQSETRFRQVVDSSPNGIILADRAGRIVLANARMTALTGYAAEELTGQPIELLVPTALHAVHRAHRAAFQEAPETRGMGGGRELFAQRRDGSLVPIEVMLQPLEMAEGPHVLAAVIDITERKNAVAQLERLNAELQAAVAELRQRESEVRANEVRFRQVVESSPNGIVLTDRAGLITLVNPRLTTLTGYTAEELLGRPVDLLVPEAARGMHHQHRESFHAAPSARGMGGGRELYVQRKDGHRVPIEVMLQPLDTAEGPMVLASLFDITERKTAVALLENLNRELEERVQRRTEELAREVAERSRAEAELLDLYNLAPCGYHSVDEDGRFLRINDTELAWLGYTREEVVGRLSFRDVLTPESRIHFDRQFPRFLEQGWIKDLEFDFVRKDGSTFRVLLNSTALRDASGKFVRTRSTLIDITDLHRSQVAVRRLDERLRLATGAAGIGVWHWDLVTRALEWDETMHRLYGVASRDFPGTYEAWAATLHPLDRAPVDRAVAACLERGGDFDTQFRVVWPDGTVRVLQAHGVVERDEAGRARQMSGTNWDVSRRVAAEEALRGERELLREFITYAPAAIAMLDRELRYLHASLRWKRDYGLGDEDLTGRRHYDVFPEVPERWREIHRRALEGEVAQAAEDPFPRADGHIDWLQWEVRPWRRTDGSVGGLLFFTQVVTERKKLQLQLEAQNQELARSNHDLAQFAYAASHDLQEPLRAVAGCLEILQQRYRGQFDTRGEQLLFQSVDGAKRMQGLIHGLLEYSRVTTRGAQLRRVSAEAALQLALANLRTAVEEAGAVITHESGAMPEVVADPVQLAQLFQNLVSNALKYRRAGEVPQVRVGAQAGPAEWTFAVRDNGIGIDPKHGERIFGLFQRLHTRTEYPGTGIGLALCRKIVERHGGRIWVESAPGAGATFFFTLPLAAATAPSSLVS